MRFAGDGSPLLIGPDDERWDLVVLVRYPSVEAFLGMASNDDDRAGLGHRTAALEDSRLLPIEETALLPSSQSGSEGGHDDFPLFGESRLCHDGSSDGRRRPVSHQSGFRPGGHDFTHRQPPKSQRKGRGTRSFDQKMDQRFRDHERKAKPQPTEQDEATED